MSHEQLKHDIRHRLYAARRAAGQDPGPLAELFMTCPTCAGRGKVCEEFRQDGRAWAVLDTCPKCAGEGFVAK
jgi:DnaJ-class molecular chaperone